MSELEELAADNSELTALIESRQLEVQCPHCCWSEFRALSWLSLQRDMNCPVCEDVIVLNTSERKREILRLRRQVSALYKQLLDMLPVADSFERRISQGAAPRQVPNLALARPPAPSAGRREIDGNRHRERRIRR